MITIYAKREYFNFVARNELTWTTQLHIPDLPDGNSLYILLTMFNEDSGFGVGCKRPLAQAIARPSKQETVARACGVVVHIQGRHLECGVFIF